MGGMRRRSFRYRTAFSNPTSACKLAGMDFRVVAHFLSLFCFSVSEPVSSWLHLRATTFRILSFAYNGLTVSPKLALWFLSFVLSPLRFSRCCRGLSVLAWTRCSIGFFDLFFGAPFSAKQWRYASSITTPLYSVSQANEIRWR